MQRSTESKKMEASRGPVWWLGGALVSPWMRTRGFYLEVQRDLRFCTSTFWLSHMAANTPPPPSPCALHSLWRLRAVTALGPAAERQLPRLPRWPLHIACSTVSSASRLCRGGTIRSAVREIATWKETTVSEHCLPQGRCPAEIRHPCFIGHLTCSAFKKKKKGLLLGKWRHPRS